MDVAPTLAVIIVSANSEQWLVDCISSLRARVGETEMQVIVVDSGSTDSTAGVAESLGAKVARVENHGFAHANNRGLEVATAEWVLFLNPDTKLLDGTLSDLIDAARSHPRLGVAGVRRLRPDGSLDWSIRRFPSPVRWLGEAIGSESLPWRRRAWSGERVLDSARYALESEVDWTSGSCMLARTAMLQEIGGMDERFFLYSEEPDLCLRARAAGWETWHLPALTIVHYGGNEQSDGRLAAQLAHSRRLFVQKHGSRVQRMTGIGALLLGSALRSALGRTAGRRAGARAALRTLLGLEVPPFESLTVSRGRPPCC